ncbi:MAG: right-handed parallel beta-helix repeat-containing protein [Phycisphaerales bacterium]|nr:MAG: right-handed parallel beta-helix repeat-containing protein [Phycisphaerales bacterium]
MSRRCRKRHWAAVWVVLLAAGVRAPARTISVGPGSSHDFATIQAALNDASDGDRIIVADGTYTGNGNRDIDFLGKAVVVQSENGPEQCIIDCNGSQQEPHRGFLFQNAEDANSVLRGVTIRNGYAIPYGGAIYCRGSGPTIAECKLCENRAYKIGGAMYNELAGPTVTDCRFLSNSAESGGAVASASGEPMLSNCTFIANSAQTGGGAIYSSLTGATLLNCTFVNNSAEHGGAVFEHRGSSRLTDCKFVGNGAHSGAGILNYESEPVLAGCSFEWNLAVGGGGGLYNSYSEPTLVGCGFKGNRAAWGGGIENYAGAARLSSCTFAGNRADWGGAMRDYASSVILTNCLLSGNIARTAGGIYNRDGTELVVTNCTFADNSADQGSALAFDSHKQKYPGSAEATNAIFRNGGNELWNNDDSQIVIRYSDVQGGWPGEGNFDSDPCFADAGYWDANSTALDANDDFWISGDYHLKSRGGRWNQSNRTWMNDEVSSPCIDAGCIISPVGFEPFPNGGIVNLGAYGGTAEAAKSFFGPRTCQKAVAGDINGDCRVDLADFTIMAAHWASRR